VPTSRLATVSIAITLVGVLATTTNCASSSDPSGEAKRKLSADRPAASSAARSPGAIPPTAAVPTSAPATSGPVPSESGGPAAPGTAADGTRLLPRGGTALFPRYRLVGYSGGEASEAFGRLGIGKLDARIREIERTGRAYTAGGRTPLPVLELITVIVHASPGKDGMYRSRIGDEQIARYLAAARRHKALLLLNIQPGRADFLPEVKSLERWLAEPDVGIALDPEWAVGKRQTPGRVYGRTTAKELNSVAAYLSAFTGAHKLPQKAMVVHQLAPRIIHRVQDVRRRPGVEIMLSVDGIGARVDKEATWRKLVKPLPTAVRPGFKLFFEEDREHGKLMTPRQVLKLKPTPDYVLYE
jgi:hypothetical protein